MVTPRFFRRISAAEYLRDNIKMVPDTSNVINYVIISIYIYEYLLYDKLYL